MISPGKLGFAKFIVFKMDISRILVEVSRENAAQNTASDNKPVSHGSKAQALHALFFSGAEEALVGLYLRRWAIEPVLPDVDLILTEL